VNDEGTLVSSCGNCLQDYEARLLAAMRGVGPWYDDNPGRHLVSRHRCPSHNEPKNTWIIAGGMQAAFPELWHNAKVAYACVESVLPSTGSDLDMYRAITREVHLPYFTNGNAMEPVPPAAARQRSVGFAGSLRHRDWIAEEMKEEDILDSGDSVGVSDPAKLRTFLQQSKFALQPVGDTQVLIEGDMRVGVQPSGQQVYTSLHAGTPLVFTEHVRPPLRLWDWHGVAIDSFAAGLLANHTSLDDDRAAEVEVAKFGRGWRTMLDAEAAQKVALSAMRSTSLRARRSKTVNESLAPEPWQLIRTARLPLRPERGGPPASLQRALDKYPSFMQGFEAARAPFIWRTRPFRAQLRRVLQFAFLAQPSLAKARSEGDRRAQPAAAQAEAWVPATPAEYTASHRAHTPERSPDELKAAAERGGVPPARRRRGGIPPTTATPRSRRAWGARRRGSARSASGESASRTRRTGRRTGRRRGPAAAAPPAWPAPSAARPAGRARARGGRNRQYRTARRVGAQARTAEAAGSKRLRCLGRISTAVWPERV